MVTRAFTLIELLIVVAIIAILAAIAVPNFLEAQTRAKVSRARADMRTESTGLETYRMDHNMYPRQVDAFVQTDTFYTRGASDATPWWHEHIPTTLTTPVSYLNSIPQDPFKPLVADWRLWLKPYEGRHMFFNTKYGIAAVPANLTRYTNYSKYCGEWAIFSYGPDRKYYNQPGATGAKTDGQWIDYDATNGTVSLGNVIRTQKNGEVFGVVPSYLY